MVKILLDPSMYHPHLSVAEECFKAADLGYEYIELSPRADFHEWHHYPKVDDTEVAKKSPIFPRNWLSQHVSALPLKPVEPARERQRTAESKPPAAENRPDPSSQTRSPQFRHGQF